jgi:hypothetical protein
MSAYLLKLATTALFLCLLVAGGNALIDPYGMWEFARIDGLNRYKSDFTDGMQTSKPHTQLQRRAEVLLLGSSRVGEGLSCDMLAVDSCYNAALPGGSIYEALRLLQQAGKTTRSVYLGLDFETAIKGIKTPTGFSERRFITTKEQHWNRWYLPQGARDYFSLLLAVDTSASSLQTIWQQPPANMPIISRSLADDGSWDLRPRREQDSAAVFAQQQARVYRLIQAYSRGILKQALAGPEAALQQRMDHYFTLLRQLAATADKAGIKLQLFVNPSHAFFYTALSESGASEYFMTWLEQLQQLHASGALGPEPIWNFAGLNQYSTSPLPDQRRNPWFNDPIHYNRNLGEIMLQRMLQGCGSAAGDSFGECLHSMDLKGYTAEFRQQLQSYSAGPNSSQGN